MDDEREPVVALPELVALSPGVLPPRKWPVCPACGSGKVESKGKPSSTGIFRILCRDCKKITKYTEKQEGVLEVLAETRSKAAKADILHRMDLASKPEQPDESEDIKELRAVYQEDHLKFIDQMGKLMGRRGRWPQKDSEPDDKPAKSEKIEDERSLELIREAMREYDARHSKGDKP